MKPFNGFPARAQYTPIPNAFFSELLPQITDVAELKTTLHIFREIYGKKGYPRYVSISELLSDKGLLLSLCSDATESKDVLRGALNLAAKRGTILRLVLDNNGKPEDIYLLNTEADKRVADKINNGELVLSGLKTGRTVHPDGDTALSPDIFTLYEENIGMLTPMIAEELMEAEKLYPEKWISDAIREAANLNKRSWRYIHRILENWSQEGRGDGTYRRDTKTGAGKYTGQKYGHIIHR